MTLHINNPELEAQLEKFAEATGDKSKTLEQQASELLASAIQYRDKKLQKLRDRLAVGAAQADRGEFSTKTADDIKREGLERYNERNRNL